MFVDFIFQICHFAHVTSVVYNHVQSAEPCGLIPILLTSINSLKLNQNNLVTVLVL